MIREANAGDTKRGARKSNGDAFSHNTLQFAPIAPRPNA
jgi:hypothetical protein